MPRGVSSRARTGSSIATMGGVVAVWCLVAAGPFDAGAADRTGADPRGLSSAQSTPQGVSGWVVEQGWLEPVVDARVLLLDDDLVELEEAVTDAEGRFHLDRPPPGTYLLQARKEGVSSMLSDEIVVTGGGEIPEVVLEFPSPLMQAVAACFTEEGSAAGAALVGVAFHADTGIPLPDARIVLEGTDPDEGPPWRAEAIADAGGRYHVCGIPVGVELVAWVYSLGQVSRHAERVPVDEVSITRADLAVNLDLVEAGVDVLGTTILGVPDERGTLAGRLVDARGGEPVNTAVIRLVGTNREVVTTNDGRFRFEGVEAGPLSLETEHLAYGIQRLEVELPPGSDVSVELRIAPQVLALDGIEVTARSREGTIRAAPVGRHVVAGEELQRVQERGGSVTSVVRTFPGLRIQEVEGAGIDTTAPFVCIESFRRAMGLQDEGCQMVAVVVDGIPLPRGSASDYLVNLQVHEFESIEYLSPLEAGFQYGLDASAYGALVLWTRGRGPHVSRVRDRQP